MDELKKSGESLASCFKNLAEIKAEISLQEDSTQVSDEFPWPNSVGEGYSLLV